MGPGLKARLDDGDYCAIPSDGKRYEFLDGEVYVMPPCSPVVEVLSQASAAYDRSVKSRHYAAFGVQHYWIVDPPARTLECYENEGGTLCRGASAGAERPLAHPGFPGFVLPENFWP